MKLTDIGEFGLIHRIAPHFTKNLSSDILGIGDDCAVIPHNAAESLLITTDLLIEDVHFLRRKITPRQLGHKSLAVNLSDIAAMGGTPTAAFLSIGVPKETSIEWLDEFFAGIQNLSEQTATPLLGGDTTKSLDRIIINFAVLGKAHPDKIKFRSSALVDDVICVTDYLGDSGGGLNIILNNLNDEKNPDKQQLILAHHQPLPRLAEGKWLAEQAGVHAMMDVSDGIDSDIKRIMEESHVGARVDVVDIPISPTLRAVSRHYGWNVTEIAATGGEDYCLLCTIDPSHYRKIANDFAGEFGRPLFKIGTIKKGAELYYYQNGQRIDFAKHGWDHFR